MKMKKLLGLTVAGVAVFVLSGCAGEDGELLECNTVLQYLNSTSGSGANSSVKMTNDSTYVIDRVFTGTSGNTEVSSVYIPTDPGEYFLANSNGGCNRDEIFRIIDEEGCSQSIDFYRACGETANFRVLDRY